MERVRVERTGIKDKSEIYRILKEKGYSVYEWYDPPGTYYPTHTHPDREVRWVIEGEVVIGTEGKEITLKEGDMIELEPGTPHWAKTEKGVRYICGSK
ncbi:hypothetical protein JCM9492_02630 [Aquifex pyrophilus]